MTNTDKRICPVDSFKHLEAYAHADRISEIAPTDYHQNNASLVNLARLVKSYEHAIDRAATQRELEFVFDRWSLVARRFWRPELTRDDYYAEFLEMYSYIKGRSIATSAGFCRRAGPAPSGDLSGDARHNRGQAFFLTYAQAWRNF